MELMRLEEAASELLAEAGKAGNLLLRMHDDEGEFVKAKRAYAEPTVRSLYMQAFYFLLEQGQISSILKNREMEVYELTAVGHAARNTASQVKAQLIAEIQKAGQAFKIHSLNGDFVQCGPWAHDSMEHERIMFLEALCDLLSHGVIQVIAESKEISRYEMAPVSSGLMS